MKKRLLGKILKFIKRESLLEKGDRVLIALSGGADSVFMTEIFRDISRILGVYFECAHINHGIRKEADKDEEFVRKFCADREINLNIKRIEGLKIDDSALEERARNERYRLLEEIRRKRGLDLIATAHTQNDSVETVIHNMLRGGGIKGLTGILPKRGNVIRPILPVRKDEIVEFLKGQGIPFVEDMSNYDTRFTRNYIRHEIIPRLEHVNSDFGLHLFRMGLVLNEYVKWINQRLNSLRSNVLIHTDYVDVFKVNLTEFPSDVYMELLKIYGKSPVYDEIDTFLEILKSGDGHMLYRKVDIILSHGELSFLKKEKYSLYAKIKDKDENFVEDLFNYRVSINRGEARGKMECNISEDMFPFVIRTRKDGDRIGSKKLKDRFIALKIPYWRRDFWPIFEKDGKIFFVPGIYKECGLEGPLKLEVDKNVRGKFSLFD